MIIFVRACLFALLEQSLMYSLAFSNHAHQQ